jgi:probable F420-dependent oxidoreductase
MGAGSILVPEQRVVLESDPAAARAIGRRSVKPYLGLVNYTNNLRRLGYGDADFADDGSDGLIDALVGWGPDDAVAARLQEHRDAGADQVTIQLLTTPDVDAVEQYTRLARALHLGG